MVLLKALLCDSPNSPIRRQRGWQYDIIVTTYAFKWHLKPRLCSVHSFSVSFSMYVLHILYVPGTVPGFILSLQHTYAHTLPINPRTSTVCPGGGVGPSSGQKDALGCSALVIVIPSIPLCLLWVSQRAGVLRVLKTMQTFDDLLKALVAKAYYSKRIHNRINKGKRHKVESGDIHAQALLQYLHLVRGHSGLPLPQ